MARTAGPATAKVLVFKNQGFLEPKDTLLAALATTDPTLRPDVVFPGRIDEVRTQVLALYAGGDLPDAQWVHPLTPATVAVHWVVHPVAIR